MEPRWQIWTFWWAVVAILIGTVVGIAVCVHRLPATEAYAIQHGYMLAPLPPPEGK